MRSCFSAIFPLSTTVYNVHYSLETEVANSYNNGVIRDPSSLFYKLDTVHTRVFHTFQDGITLIASAGILIAQA